MTLVFTHFLVGHDCRIYAIFGVFSTQLPCIVHVISLHLTHKMNKGVWETVYARKYALKKFLTEVLKC